MVSLQGFPASRTLTECMQGLSIQSLSNDGAKSLSNDDLLMKQVAYRLQAYVQHLPYPLPHLGELLQKYHAVLAGSFPVRFLIPEERAFTPGDMDIFLAGDKHSMGIIREFDPLVWQVYSYDFDEFNDYDSVGSFHQMKLYSKLNHASLSRATADLVVNLIWYRVDEFKDLFEKFDLNGCTLNWNGGDRMSRGRMNDTEWEAFTNRFQMVYNPTEALKKMIKNVDDHRFQTIRKQYPQITIQLWNYPHKINIQRRIAKYQARGFTVVNASQVVELMKEFP